ncbi:MAG: hypothetical protein WDN31_10850 [Hyphomicrobium sp.]
METRVSVASVTSAALSRRVGAVVGTIAAEPRCLRQLERIERRSKCGLGTHLVAHHGQRGAELGLGKRRREAVETRVGVVA